MSVRERSPVRYQAKGPVRCKLILESVHTLYAARVRAGGETDRTVPR